MKDLPLYTKHHARNASAYTLIEVLVVVTIIGILFGVGYANFREFSNRQAVVSAAKKLQGDLRLTQEIAMAGQKPSDANCDSPTHTLNGYNFRILSASSYEIRASCSGGLSGTAYKTVTLDTNATFASPFPSPNPILFKVLGNGTNIPEGQEIVIKMVQTGTSNQSNITISSGGQIK